MSLFNVFGIAGSSLSANALRLNVTASNLANANTVNSSIGQTYRAREPVFAAITDPTSPDGSSAGVRVLGVVQSNAPLHVHYEPNNPLADSNGYVYTSNVNSVEEMANMIAASQAYQSSVDVMSTSKQLLIRTLSLGQ